LAASRNRVQGLLENGTASFIVLVDYEIEANTRIASISALDCTA
jgi:hypothetical protein